MRQFSFVFAILATWVFTDLGLAQPPGISGGKKAATGYVPTGSSSDAEVDARVSSAAKFQTSDGSRIEIADKGFSIVPPAGWEVSRDHPQLSFVMQIPYQKGMKYQRTIQVASFGGPKYIDGTTAREFEELIVRKFSRASASVEDYRIRNHLTVEMADGRPGLLFYSEFALDRVPLMQMHVLVSSDNRHYLMTYTDLAKHFEDDGATTYLTRAWDSMISVQVAGPSPSRFGLAIQLGVAVGVLVFFFILFRIIQGRKAKKDYQRYSTGEGLDDVPNVTQDETFIVPKAAELEDSDEGLPDATMAQVSFAELDDDEPETAYKDERIG